MKIDNKELTKAQISVLRDLYDAPKSLVLIRLSYAGPCGLALSCGSWWTRNVSTRTADALIKKRMVRRATRKSFDTHRYVISRTGEKFLERNRQNNG